MYFDLKGFPVDFRHPLHFFEANMVVILESVTFVVMQQDETLLILRNVGN